MWAQVHLGWWLQRWERQEVLFYYFSSLSEIASDPTS